MKHPRQSATDWMWGRQGGKRGKFTERLTFSTSRFDPSRPATTIAWNPRRLQNMILAVGPTTVAARACRAQGRRSRHHDSDDEDVVVDSEMEEEDDDDDDDDGSSANNTTQMDTVDEEAGQENERAVGDAHGQVDSSSDEDGIMDDSQAFSDDEEAASLRSVMESSRDAYMAPPASQRPWVHEIQHESCINTACWLDVPWRLSVVNSDRSPTTVASWETPTQLITSGDDHLVKFWDARHAMGSTSPPQEGWDVFTPFSTMEGPASTNLSARNGSTKNQMPPGAVLPLATLVSGHLGNVFHVSPVPSTPGLVLTCGADGQLRSCHVEREQSSKLVMRPMSPTDDDSDSDDYYMMHLGMAYSHQLLTANTGLLCSDRGLFHFDMRLAPRDQPRQPFKLVPNKQRGWRSYVSRIKSCAVWSPSLGTDGARQSQLVDSNYVFAGGAGEEVHMFDLRMESSREESSRVVERYRPRVLKNADNVSVCGIDVSRDGRELLVSYESDQIYTFPIFNQASSAAGPTLDEIDEWSNLYLDDADKAVPDLASYGAHLNRFTFLKSARYAGPKDDYICTGSDSGHAWIYRKSTGAVASLLSADTHVCNGIVPHPTLPVFITYGIDSTAKVWRASPPVDVDSSDSNDNRAMVARSRPYQMSPVVKNPEQVQQRCTIFEDVSTDMTVFPDFIPTTQEVLCAGRFMPNMLWCMAAGCDGAPRIGNALRTLPYLLRSNRYECCRAVKADREGPIEGPLKELAHRLSRMRLQHQADQIGVTVNSNDHPYLWCLPDPSSDHLHPADMVPDFPSDWIQWDPAMDQNPQSVLPKMTLEENPTVESRENAAKSSQANNSFDSCTNRLSRYPWLREFGKGEGDVYSWPTRHNMLKEESDGDMEESDGEEGPAPSFSDEAIEYSRKALYYTALLCKEGGNEAMKKNMLEVAARRYDKSIQYCAVVFLKYEGSATHVPHLTKGMSERIPLDRESSKKTAYVYSWCPLLRVWISCHLNLALIFLKPGLCKFQSEARNQAEIALRLLAPYTRESGKVFYQARLLRDDEPEETYRVARQLQAKAYFRLGSAELDIGDYLSAVRSLEASIASTDGPVEPATQKRLSKAKLRSTSQKKRNRRRFEVAMAGGQMEPPESPMPAR